MYTGFCPIGQAQSLLDDELPAREFDWRPMEEGDREIFERFPEARFLIRPWSLVDDRFDQDWLDAPDLVLFTVVFRGGLRMVGKHGPTTHSVSRAANLAEHFLRLHPTLAADARPHDHRTPVQLGQGLQISGCRYVDAAGTFRGSGSELTVMRGFCRQNIEPFWRDYLSRSRANKRRLAMRAYRKLPWHKRRLLAFRTFR